MGTVAILQLGVCTATETLPGFSLLAQALPELQGTPQLLLSTLSLVMQRRLGQGCMGLTVLTGPLQ